MSKVNGDLLVQGFHLNLKPEQLATDPTLVELGSAPRIWGNSTDGKLKYHNGTEIVDLTALGLTEEDLTTALEEYVKTADLPAPVDISGLATKTELAGEVADLATKVELADYVKTAELPAPVDISGLATKTELTTAVTGLVSDAELATAIADFVTDAELTSELATATQNLVSTSVMQGAIDNALAGLDFQSDVLGLESDFVDVAGRYVFVDGTSFTSGVAAAAGDIVEVSTTGEILSVAYDVSVAGPGALVWNRAASLFFRYDGTVWAEFGGLTGFTAGNGLTKTGDVVSVDAADASIVVDANGIKVGDLSATYVTPAALATAVTGLATDAELTDAVADLVSETALTTALADYVLTADLPEPVDVSGLVTDAELAAVVSRIEASEFQFTPQAAGTSFTVTHNFGNKYPIVQVVDTDDTVIGVQEIKFVDANSLTVTLAVSGTPKVIVQGLKALV